MDGSVSSGHVHVPGCGEVGIDDGWKRIANASRARRGVALLGKNVRRRPTLPQPPGCSTIGAERLEFRVRDGTGYFPLAKAAVTLAGAQPILMGRRAAETLCGAIQLSLDSFFVDASTQCCSSR